MRSKMSLTDPNKVGGYALLCEGYFLCTGVMRLVAAENRTLKNKYETW
jgi:hypothetical protein